MNHPTFSTLEETERQQILDVLASTKWRIRGAKDAAEILGLKPTTLEYRMSKLGTTRPLEKHGKLKSHEKAYANTHLHAV